MTLPAPPLLVITDRRQARRPLEEIAAAAFAAGCRWLSLREKDLPAAERQALLQRLVAIARGWNACVGVHDDIATAAAAGAGAVHLPEGGAVDAARASLPPGMLIGQSVHDEAGLARAAAAGADYVTLSPIFASRSKPGYGPPLGPARLARAAAGAGVPLVALGGIDAARVGDCIAAGAAGIAVMGGVMAADDPAAAVAMLVARLGAALARRADATHSHSHRR